MALAAGACAAPTGDGQNKPALAGGGSVCVASAIGHRFDVQTIGIMVFGNDLKTADIGPWGIDEMAVSKIATLLGPSFTVRQISFPKGAIEAIETPRRDLFRDRVGEFNTALRAAAASAPKCDYYITVTRGSSQFSNTNQGVTGVGILKRDTIIGPKYFTYAIVMARLYDSALDWKRPKLDLEKAFQYAFSSTGIRGPSREVAAADWPAPPLVDVQNAKLRETARTLVDEALTNAVPQLWSATDF